MYGEQSPAPEQNTEAAPEPIFADRVGADSGADFGAATHAHGMGPPSPPQKTQQARAPADIHLDTGSDFGDSSNSAASTYQPAQAEVKIPVAAAQPQAAADTGADFGRPADNGSDFGAGGGSRGFGY